MVNSIPIIINLILFHHFFFASSSHSDLMKSHIAKINDTIAMTKITITIAANTVCMIFWRLVVPTVISMTPSRYKYIKKHHSISIDTKKSIKNIMMSDTKFSLYTYQDSWSYESTVSIRRTSCTFRHLFVCREALLLFQRETLIEKCIS